MGMGNEPVSSPCGTKNEKNKKNIYKQFFFCLVVKCPISYILQVSCVGGIT